MDIKESLPKKIIRLDDGMEFVLNEGKNTYSIKLPELGHPIPFSFEYTYERLMEDPRDKGKFKVADGTEDLKSMRKAWFESMIRRTWEEEDE